MLTNKNYSDINYIPVFIYCFPCGEVSYIYLFLVSCCVKRKCWCFVTEGMGAANQEEMVTKIYF